MTDLFCPKPFEHFELQHDGKAYACCPGWLPESLGAVNGRSFQELWNGEAAQRIRRSILDGSFRYCTSCPLLGAVQGPVKRIGDVKDPVHLAILREQRVVVERIRVLYLAYDRTCNLSCPSCRTEVIVASGSKLRRLATFQEALITPELLRSIDVLNVTGSGDPFASSLFRTLLRSLNAADYPRLRIVLHTNGLLFTEENWEAMKGAQPLMKTVEVSVDAASAATYALNRRGGDFGVLLERLAFIQSLRAAGAIPRFKLSFVVQANNWREMPAFARLGRRFGADVVFFTPLRNWGTFTPDEFARRAVHLPGHPEHADFARELAEAPDLRDERVAIPDIEFLSVQRASEEASCRSGKRGLPKAVPPPQRTDSEARPAASAQGTGRWRGPSERLDVIVPVHGDDFARLSILRRTAARFFRFEGRCFVVVPERHYPTAAELLQGDARFVAVNELELVPALAQSRVAGWYKQQAIKLAAARLVESDFYLCLDADCFAVRPVRFENLVRDGRARVNYSPERKHQEWYFGSAALLLMRPPPRFSAATPFVFSAELVASLLEHLQGRFGAPLAPFLENPWKWTEYTLYHVYTWNQGLWERRHSPYRTKLSGNSVWFREGWEAWDPSLSFLSGEFPFTVVQSNTGLTADAVWRRIAPFVEP